MTPEKEMLFGIDKIIEFYEDTIKFAETENVGEFEGVLVAYNSDKLAHGEKVAHERISNSLGVPAELVSGGDSTFANRQEARKELYHEEVIPWCRDLTKRFNNFLSPWLKEGERIDFITSSIPALQSDLASVISSLEGIKDRVSINEYRKIVADMSDYDLEAVDNGDDIMLPSTMVTLENNPGLLPLFLTRLLFQRHALYTYEPRSATPLWLVSP